MSSKFKKIPIQWYFPEHIETKYVTNIVVQHTDKDFVVSFFDVFNPPILGDPEKVKKDFDAIKSVQAKCVARIAVTPEKMKDFIDTLQKNYKDYQKTMELIRKDVSTTRKKSSKN